ncbi:hypothetical protein BDQ12DRAFT_68616 [Crucibulum laeve]|uniref:Uncharacterized protein n=1 Tax=Crucibulum laeve TaxID=68775 RepID=A0A5C3LH02_9AGAR|nr:hypothetical protein BDQ12DRAFT_68616 [Crucibulum laeve]
MRIYSEAGRHTIFRLYFHVSFHLFPTYCQKKNAALSLHTKISLLVSSSLDTLFVSTFLLTSDEIYTINVGDMSISALVIFTRNNIEIWYPGHPK